MLSGVCVGTNDLGKAKAFYSQVLKTIGMSCLFSERHELGFGAEGGDVTFWVVTPYNEQPATFGNGTQVMFKTKSKDAVIAFYEQALALGGVDEGAPGPRDYTPDYYGAYCRDLDGNKLHISIQSD